MADDFSGAAEMAGIAYTYGLKTRLITQFDPQAPEDVLIINTNTRSLSEKKAREKISNLVKSLPADASGYLLFKKIDSVLRGHILPEIEVIQNRFQFKRIFVLPANPSKGRRIVGGEYFVNDLPLHQTAFAEDPYFPVQSSSVFEIITAASVKMSYRHLAIGDKIPSNGILSGDVAKMEDFNFYLQQITHRDLLCGAADSFSLFLAKIFQAVNKSKKPVSNKEYQVVFNGSSIKNATEKRNFSASNFVQVTCPAYSNDQDSDPVEWFSEILNLLEQKKKVAVEIPHPVVQSRTASDFYLKIFATLAVYITKNIARQSIHFWLTGGETAVAIMEGLSASQLELIAQMSPGSVTFETIDNRKMHLTVKPGSYAWPDFLYNQ